MVTTRRSVAGEPTNPAVPPREGAPGKDDDEPGPGDAQMAHQRRVWGPDAGKPRPDRTRPYRLLDVYSVEQGSLRMRLFVSLMGLFVAVGAFLVLTEVLGYSIADMDSADMLDAFTRTSQADAAAHASFPPPQITASLSGTRVSLGTRSVRRGEIEDPRLRSIAPLPVELADTSFAASYLSGSARVPRAFPDGAAPSPAEFVVVALSSGESESGVFGGSRRVPLWRVEVDWDSPVSSREATLMPLSSVACVIHRFAGGWSLTSVSPRYDEVTYRGPASALAGATPSSTVVSVVVHDAAQPVGPALPSWITFWRVLVGLVLVVSSVFMSCCCCCFSYIVRRNSRENMGLPPPFFASWRRFRGW